MVRALSFDLKGYFERIGYSENGGAPLERLRQVHFRHMLSIPFENLNVYLKKEISLTPEDIERKFLVERRGGYCFEQNALFFLALSEMGFQVKPLVVRLFRQGTGFAGFTHRQNMVQIGSDRYAVDVGYGGNCFTLPVKLEFGTVQEQTHATYRVVEDDTDSYDYIVQILDKDTGEFVNMVAILDTPATDEDFIIGNFYTSQNPASFFRGHIMCSLYTETGRHSLFDNRLTVLENGGTRVIEVTQDSLGDILKEYFMLDVQGIALPPQGV